MVLVERVVAATRALTNAKVNTRACRIRTITRDITTRPEFRPPGVHVLGLGSIGTFAAHSLLEIPPPWTPQTTLLLHRPSLAQNYCDNKGRISLDTITGNTVHRSGYRLETLHGDRWSEVDVGTATPNSALNLTTPTCSDVIENLIISVKGTQTVAALRPLRHRLNASSNILFLQNGCGMMEDVSEELFQNAETRPNYIIGVISHGVTLNSPFNITHTGSASTSLGLVPRAGSLKDQNLRPSDPYLLQSMPLVPRLNATAYSFLDVFQIQLEKLAVNAFCNPICALNNAKTKFLFTIPKTQRAMLAEISRVICSLPELQGVPGVLERFSTDRLEATVSDVIKKNAETTCSMVFDIRHGRKTDVAFINGYWSRRGREVGVPTPLNDDLVRQIQEKGG